MSNRTSRDQARAAFQVAYTAFMTAHQHLAHFRICAPIGDLNAELGEAMKAADAALEQVERILNKFDP